jgi:hypothetical protein
MQSEPKKIRARDIKPYYWGMNCFLGESKTPTLIQIVNMKWDDLDYNKLWIMLETHNYVSVDADEELEVYPMEVNEFYLYEGDSRRTFQLPPPPSNEETLLNRLTKETNRLKETDPKLSALLVELRKVLYQKEKAIVDMGILLNDLIHGKVDVKRS